MTITAATLNLTPILTEAAQTTFLLERPTMAGFWRAEIVLVTDLPAASPIPHLTLSVKPALWLTPTGVSGTVNNKGFDTDIPPGATDGISINAMWGGNTKERNFNAKVTPKKVAGFWNVECAIEFQDTYDLGSYITSSPTDYNATRLLNNVVDSSIDLSNSSASAYTFTKKAAFDCYLTEITSPVSPPQVQFLGWDKGLSFYDDIVFPIKNNGVVQNFLFSNQPNLLEVQYIYDAPVTAWTAYNPVVMLICIPPTSTENIATHYSQAYKLSSKQIFLAGNVKYPDHVAGGDPYWNGFSQNDKIKATGGTDWIPDTPPQYKFNFEIDETLLATGERYRLIFLFQFKDPNPPHNCAHYSVITSELLVVDTPPPAAPDVDSEIEIYFDKYNANGIQVSPKNRVLNRVILDTAPYDGVRGAGEFISRIKEVTLELYYEVTSGANTFRHTQVSISQQKDGSGVFPVTQGLEIIMGGTTVTAEYSHRLRYEDNLTALFSKNVTTNTPIPPPVGSMDMTGRNMFVHWTFTLSGLNDDGTTADELFDFFQFLNVDNYNATLTFELQDGDGNPIMQLCSDLNPVCIQAIGGVTSPAIALIDKAVFGIGSIREFDGGSAGAGVVIPQLQESPIISSDAAFVADVHKACFDTNAFPLLTDLKYAVIWKAPYICGDADAQAIVDFWAANSIMVTDARRQLICETVIALKDCGVWGLMDAIWFMAAQADGSRHLPARTNWKDPGGAYELTEVNAITFTPDVGYTADGASTYLITNWTQPNPFPDISTKFDQSTGLWVSTTPTVPYAFLGPGHAGGLTTTDDWLPAANQSYLYEDIPADVSITFATGFVAYQADYRGAVARNRVYQSGLQVGVLPFTVVSPCPPASSSPPSAMCPDLGGDNLFVILGGGGGVFPSSDATGEIAYIGRAMSDAQHLCLALALADYRIGL